MDGVTMYGYVRVSSRDQNEARQMEAMAAFGVSATNVYLDKQSGRDFQRPQYRKLMRKLHANDVLVVKSIDRLDRNYDEILEQWRIITKRKRAAIVVLDMPLLDTRRDHDLTGTLIADIVLQLLSYVSCMSICLTFLRLCFFTLGELRQIISAVSKMYPGK